MKFQFLPENFSRSENAPPFETRKIRLFEVERIFLENKKMVQEFPSQSDPQFLFQILLTVRKHGILSDGGSDEVSNGLPDVCVCIHIFKFNIRHFCAPDGFARRTIASGSTSQENFTKKRQKFLLIPYLIGYQRNKKLKFQKSISRKNDK